MDKKRILYVSSELVPYFPENNISKIALEAPVKMKEQGHDVRIFMPKFGVINERRYQLHEVIRLSGLNIIVNDTYQPLIIKVASVPNHKIQVYFIDNDEYFQNKDIYHDSKGQFLPYNDERMIFFAKGVLETVKKLNWIPDLIHIHGWMTGLIPVYLRTLYKDDPTFQETKVISSLYDNGYEGVISENMIEKVTHDDVDELAVKNLGEPTYNNVIKTMVNHSDGIIVGESIYQGEIEKIIESSKVPTMNCCYEDNPIGLFNDFYQETLS